MIRVILAEDHDILRDGLQSILADNNEIKVVAEASNGKALIDLLQTTPADIVLMDINMPVMNGIEATRYITEHYKNIKVVALSMMDNTNYLQQMMNAGAKGYILKSTGKNDMVYAIKQVMKNIPFISPELLIKQEEDNAGPAKAKLTKRELQVLELLAEGLTNKEIADKIFLSKRTIETHRKNLIDKTGSKNTSALIKYAISHGIIKS
jgi:DNA-binding NarL/FixJ family response regulator